MKKVPLLIEAFAKVTGDRSQFCSDNCAHIETKQQGFYPEPGRCTRRPVTDCKLFDKWLKFDSDANKNIRHQHCIDAEKACK